MPTHPGYEDAVNLTISLCLTYTLCIACVRLWIRKGSFGVDDIVIAVATVLTLCHSGADYTALAEGLGSPWQKLAAERRKNLRGLNEASLAAIVTFKVALYLSKCAMLSFLSRITKTPSQIRLYNTCNAVIAVLGAVSVLIATLGCTTTSGYYWAFHANRASCPSQSARWQAITGLDVLTEILLLALPIHLVWGLQMPRGKKALIILAFYLRLPVLGFAIGRNYYTLQLRLPQSDAGLNSALVVIWLEVELAYALAASTLSALKAFTESFNSGFGLGFTRGKGDTSYGLSDVSGSQQSSKTEKSKGTSNTLESGGELSRVGSPAPIAAPARALLSPKLPNAEHCEELRLRPEPQMRTLTHVSSQPLSRSGADEPAWRESSRSDSSDDDMVIMRETGYEVQHDRAPMLPAEQLPHMMRA